MGAIDCDILALCTSIFIIKFSHSYISRTCNVRFLSMIEHIVTALREKLAERGPDWALI